MIERNSHSQLFPVHQPRHAMSVSKSVLFLNANSSLKHLLNHGNRSCICSPSAGNSKRPFSLLPGTASASPSPILSAQHPTRLLPTAI